MSALLALAICAACTRRTPDVCCTSDVECERLGLPPGSVNDYGCGQGHVCRDFYCVPEEPRDVPFDAPQDALAGPCDPDAPFGAPVLLASVSSPFEDLSIALTPDQLKAYLVRRSSNGMVIMTTRRDLRTSEFPPPAPDDALLFVSADDGDELYVFPSSDDLLLLYRRDTFFASTRSSATSAFSYGADVRVNDANVFGHRIMLSSNAAAIYWSNASTRLRAATRTSFQLRFYNAPDATTFDLTDFAISPDELTLYYSNFPNPDIYRTRRFSKNVPFDIGTPVENVNTPEGDIPMYVSPDDCELYIRAPSPSSPGNDIWIARRSR